MCVETTDLAVTPFGGAEDLVGHKGTNTTETVYQKVIVPELRRGARPSLRHSTGGLLAMSLLGLRSLVSYCCCPGA